MLRKKSINANKRNYKKEEERENVSVRKNKTKTEEEKIVLFLCRGCGGIPTQSTKMSRMDSTLQMSPDLENAEINTNMQLYYSTIPEQTN